MPSQQAAHFAVMRMPQRGGSLVTQALDQRGAVDQVGKEQAKRRAHDHVSCSDLRGADRNKSASRPGRGDQSAATTMNGANLKHQALMQLLLP
jgi:hypothetical protein